MDSKLSLSNPVELLFVLLLFRWIRSEPLVAFGLFTSKIDSTQTQRENTTKTTTKREGREIKQEEARERDERKRMGTIGSV